MKLETVFKNKPFDAIRNAVEAGMGHAVPKQQTRDELAELLARYVLGNLDLWVGSWICIGNIAILGSRYLMSNLV